MIDRQRRKQEEQKLLLKVCLEDAKTEEDVIRGKLQFDFINDCLEISQVKSLMGLGQKRKGLLAYMDTIENLVQEYINKEYELGLNDIVTIRLEDIKTVWYNFIFEHTIRKGAKNVKHSNKIAISAENEEDAKVFFHRRIKELGHNLDSITQITKKLSGIYLQNGEYHSHGSFDVIRE
jgi:predicted Zn-dependent protease